MEALKLGLGSWDFRSVGAEIQTALFNHVAQKTSSIPSKPRELKIESGISKKYFLQLFNIFFFYNNFID